MGIKCCKPGLRLSDQVLVTPLPRSANPRKKSYLNENNMNQDIGAKYQTIQIGSKEKNIPAVTVTSSTKV